MEILFAVEGDTDQPFATKIIERAGARARPLPVAGGKNRLDTRIAGWNQPGNQQNILVLRDWDEDDQVPCAPTLVEKVLGGHARATGLCVRIAIRSIEAWMLADREAAAEFFGIRVPRGSPKRL